MVGLAFKLEYSKDKPKYIQLYEYLRKEIIAGRLVQNTKLPSIRKLADDLNISRTTIEATYHQLTVEGYIVSQPKVGYFVNSIDNNVFDYDRYATGSKQTPGEASKRQVEYDFRNDYIDKESFNFALWKKYLNKTLMYENERFLTYGSYQGEYELRQEIARYVHQSRGVICRPEQIIIGAGVQSLLNILCGLLKADYRDIGFEDPGFRQARHIFKDQEYNVIPIKLEDDGISLQALSQSKAKIVYVSPSNQFPTGAVMPVNKRVKLLNWAHATGALIIEDDYDSELRYFGRPIPSLQGMDNGANIIYLGSFSKILLPSIRISYMILPEKLIKNYQSKMHKYNQTSSQIEQIALSLFMKEGLLEKHIRKLRKIYAKKNQLLIDTLREIMGNKINIIGKETGLHILLELKTPYTAQEITSLAEGVGVKVSPIASYSINNEPNKYPLVLLSYGGITMEDIAPAIKLLKKVWFK